MQAAGDAVVAVVRRAHRLAGGLVEHVTELDRLERVEQVGGVKKHPDLDPPRYRGQQHCVDAGLGRFIGMVWVRGEHHGGVDVPPGHPDRVAEGGGEQVLVKRREHSVAVDQELDRVPLERVRAQVGTRDPTPAHGDLVRG